MLDLEPNLKERMLGEVTKLRAKPVTGRGEGAGVEEDAPDIEVDAEVLAGCFIAGKVEVEKC